MNKSTCEHQTVAEALGWANRALPGSSEKDELRWPAVIAVCDYVETNPEEVWDFVLRWGDHEDEDLRDAIACCGLEHLLEYHFDVIFPRVQERARSNKRFADMFARCWRFGQSDLPENAKRFDALKVELGFRPTAH
jgi:hypothetical protein